MFLITIRGESLAQIAIRVSVPTYRVLEQIAKDGHYKSVNKLIESILFEIALDESTSRDLTNKKTKSQSHEVRVA